MAKIKVKPGDSIHWAGTITRAGVEDFTGYTLECHIRKKNSTTGLPEGDPTVADMNWVDETEGTFTLEVDHADTAEWDSPACMVMDIRVISPGGERVRTETAEFETTAGVTE